MKTVNDGYGSAPASGNTFKDNGMKASVSAMAGAAGEHIADAAGQAQHVAHVQLDRLAETIRHRPIQAAGIRPSMRQAARS